MNFKKYLILVWVVCFQMTACGQPTLTETTVLSGQEDTLFYPQPVGYVNDFEQLFSDAETKQLNSLIRDFEARITIQIAIATLYDFHCDKDNFDDYTLQLSNTWGIGQKGKDNGILIAISKQFRQMRIQTGRDIENILTDEACRKIIGHYLVPSFKEENYFEGTLHGLKAIISFIESNSPPPADDCYELYTDSSSGYELLGYKQDGQVKIKAKYVAKYTDTLCTMALVLDREKGWLGIDKNGNVILVPFIFDNGPDYVKEGLFRFVENEKIGFANLDGQKIIPAQYSFATPFYEGYARYYIGGERIYENGKTQQQIMDESDSEGLIDLYWNWGGNITETGYINKEGQRFEEKPNTEQH